MNLVATASQTVGPFFHIGLEKLCVADLAKSAAGREKVSIQGRVLDGDAKPVNDALIEIWQANALGKYAHPDDGLQNARLASRDWQSRPGHGSSALHHQPGRLPGPRARCRSASRRRGVHAWAATLCHEHVLPGRRQRQDSVLALVPKERRATCSRNRGPARSSECHLQGHDETVFCRLLTCPPMTRTEKHSERQQPHSLLDALFRTDAVHERFQIEGGCRDLDSRRAPPGRRRAQA